MATARSESHSSLMALAAFACSLAIASSAFTVYNSYTHSIRQGGYITTVTVGPTQSIRQRGYITTVTVSPTQSIRQRGYITTVTMGPTQSIRQRGYITSHDKSYPEHLGREVTLQQSRWVLPRALRQGGYITTVMVGPTQSIKARKLHYNSHGGSYPEH